MATNPSGQCRSPNPSFTDVAGELLAIDTSAKASHNPCEELETQSLFSLNPNVSKAPICQTGEILSIDVSDKRSSIHSDESMKVFLRIRPLVVPPYKSKSFKPSNDKITWPKLKAGKGEKLNPEKKKISCIEVCDCHSVTILPPSALYRMKSEVYRGFSQVFSADSSQEEVYAKTVRPIVEDFIRGKSGLLVASGPSGSGKTHTVFGSAREPGLVPRALRDIFCPTVDNQDGPKWSFYLSIFEIYVDRGRMEKMSDLSPDGGEIQLQQTVLKGLNELLVTDYMQAEALIACAMLRRNIAMTNSNSQSSRSQCIIRIRRAFGNINGQSETQLNDSVLTIVDLAGAEREKRSGNQGERLLESNFINKTSMIFGLCLKSLLEHQKNPKKPLRKHFQSSLLTRYLRDYLEGKKPMALILTVRPAAEDYLETSFLLKQASPYMEIKFLNKDESAQSKRHYETMINAPHQQSKRMKVLCHTDSMAKLQFSARASDTHEELDDGDFKKVPAEPRKVPVSKVKGEITCKAHYSDSEKEREYKILSGVAKSIWNLLKEYNHKIKVLEKCNLELQNEINDLKSSCVCQKEESVELASLAASGMEALLPGGCLEAKQNVMPEEVKDGLPANTKESEKKAYTCKTESEHPQDDFGGETDGFKDIENQGDTCSFPKEQTPTCLKYKGDMEMESKPFISELKQLQGDHLSSFHEAKEDEIPGVEDYQPNNTNELEKKAHVSEAQSQHSQDDCEGEIDVFMEIKKQTAKQNEMIGEVEDCCPTNVMELEKAHICKTESELPWDECCGSSDLHGNVRNDGSYQGCDLEKEDNKASCTDKILKASFEKMSKSSSDLSSSTTSKSDCQPTCKKEKQKIYISCNGRGSMNSASESGKILTRDKSLVKTKPKRRLMPSSSVLLKHVSNLDFKDDGGTVVGRSERSSAADDNGSTTSASLLRLLRVDAHR